VNWYQEGPVQVLQRLASNELGLSEEQAQQRLQQYGANRLAEEAKVSWLRILLRQFASPLIYVILIAAVITLLFRDYLDAAVILAVVALNATIGFLQEYRAEASVQALKKLVVPKARVLRDGREREISSEELVPGDVVLLASGAKVPADLRLLSATELRIAEAMLTGESLPAEKMVAAIPEANLTQGDQRNMAFTGTIVLNGRGKGLVVETGPRTVLGQIAGNVQEMAVATSPLTEKMERFARLIGAIALVGTFIIFVVGLLLRLPLEQLFKTAVATLVAAVPESLPIIVTITMAVGITRMARRNAVIRKLPAVETLGSTTVICSDKTGTLTRNEMTVRAIYDGERTYEVTGSGYEPVGEIVPAENLLQPEAAAGLRRILRIGLLCNESDIVPADGRFTVRGDPTEGALIVAAMKARLNPQEERARFPQLGLVPFESERGYMATLHEYDDQKWIWIKGAPEQVVELCSACAATEVLRARDILDTAQRFAAQGMRVLAFAYRQAPFELNGLGAADVPGSFTLAGLQAMIDPPRPEAVEAVHNCRQAGIRVVMITGDHASTALAIGRMLGIAGDGDRALTGRELEAMSDHQLYEQVPDISVFARVSPEHKLRIVRQLMRRGEIVAVTGDGVNDAPALKAAHIGVAMGITGTDVAKETADMVVVDDNFASIFSAVEEGRVVFDNIRKVTLFLLPVGFASMLTILASKLLGVPLPYVPVQILWLNVVSNGLQDTALAFEPGEKGILQRPPRRPQEGVLSRVMLERAILVGALLSLSVLLNFTLALRDGLGLQNARTVAMTTIVLFQFFQAWNCRSESESVFRMGWARNPYLIYAVAAVFFAHLVALYVPVMQRVFQTEPLTSAEWLRILLAAASVLVVVELHKWFHRRRRG